MVEEKKKFQKPLDNTLSQYKVHDLIDLPDDYRNFPYIVLILSATCGECALAIDELLDGNKEIKAKLIAFLLDDGSSKAMKDFHDLFDKQITIIDISLETFYKLNLSTIPSFLIIDGTGQIVSKKITMKATVIRWKEL